MTTSMKTTTAAVVAGFPISPEKNQLKINKRNGVHNYLNLASFQGLFCLFAHQFTHTLFLATSMHSGANYRLNSVLNNQDY